MPDYSWIIEQYPDNVPVKVAAQVLGKPAAWVQMGLQKGTLPFGCCVNFDRNSFHIAPVALVNYLTGAREVPFRDVIEAAAEYTARRILMEMGVRKNAEMR